MEFIRSFSKSLFWCTKSLDCNTLPIWWPGDIGGSMVTHKTMDMTGLQDPAQWLGQGVSRINDTRDVGQDDGFLILDPGLDGEALDVNMSTSFSRYTVVDHVDGRCIILIHDSRLVLYNPQLMKDGSKIKDCLGR